MESKFKIFVIVAIVVLALAIPTSTFFVLRTFNNAQTKEVVEVEHKPELKEIALGDAILTNITAEGSSVQHFVKIQISIGVDASDEKAYAALSTEVTEKSASIRNELITIIGEQTYSMLSASNAKIKLADEIIIKLNTLLDTDLIYEVYYIDFFVQ